ncbi:HEAT repeat domain-containing protein [Streptomyces sp. NPDC020800]|uniref:HEAT repeat domain-containing protein n=1 Tax=Streptomyces sp. NPDC020800 TaxID=3365092 RepID=UPI0037A8C4C1
MFRGIDDVDWASMSHAYTQSATDVPELLRGLASHDPVRREVALDGMYGAVHHQGDVYDSTVACIPFLFELIGNPAFADRGAVVGLLCSIAHTADAVEEAYAGDEDDEDFTGFDEDDEEEWLRHSFAARVMVRERAGAFLPLLGDPDPEVRAAVADALARLHPDPAGVFGALCDRMPAETDPGTARSLACALGTLAERYPVELGTEAARVLQDVVSGTPDPRLRMTALTRLARCAPGELPPDTADIALDVMRLAREADELGPPPAPPERPHTNTLISHVRELHAEHRRSLDLDDAADLLEELDTELRDRVDLRCALLVGQLGSPDPRRRRHAVGMAGRLLSGWRAPDDEPLQALARLLTDDDLRVQKAVLSELRYLAPAAHRVSEEVIAYLQTWEHRPLEADTPFASLAVGMAFEVLALQGDDRVVPALARILEAVEIPGQLARWIRAFEPEGAAPLGPVLHNRLAGLDNRTPSSDQGRLIDALGALQDPGSVPLLTRVLAEAEQVCTTKDALRALSAFGPGAAAEALPVVRQLWEGDSVADEHRIHVAHALWALTGDTEAVLPAVRASLRSRMWSERSAALDLISSLGRSGAALAPGLREMIGAGHTPAKAAIGLWQVTGEAEETVPVIVTEWSATAGQRPGMAACLAAMGPAAAPALPLIRAELASPRRHTNDDSTGNMRYDVAADVALQTDCRRVLAGFGEHPDTPVR